MSQKLVTFAAFVAVAVFVGTVVYTLPRAGETPNDPPPVKPVTPDPNTPDPATPAPTDPANPTDPGDEPDPTEEPGPKVVPAIPLDPARPVLPTLEPVEVNGGDVADFLNLRLSKFRITVPQGKYTVHVWAERWKRDAEKPDEIVLAEYGTEVDAVDIVAQLPIAGQPEGFLRVNAVRTRVKKPLVPTGAYFDVLKKAGAFDLGSDLHLLTYTWNETTRAEGGLKDVHKNHDLTIYLKARLVPGDFTPFKKPAADTDEGGGTNAPLTAPDTDIE